MKRKAKKIIFYFFLLAHVLPVVPVIFVILDLIKVRYFGILVLWCSCIQVFIVFLPSFHADPRVAKSLDFLDFLTFFLTSGSIWAYFTLLLLLYIQSTTISASLT